MIRIGSVEETAYEARDGASQLWVPRPRGPVEIGMEPGRETGAAVHPPAA